VTAQLSGPWRALSLQFPLAEGSQTRKTGPSAMLDKCANPACKVPFHSLREGKLFLAETFPSDLNTAFDGNRRKLCRREHFWLCSVCSVHFTLRFDATAGMLTVPLSEPVRPRFLVHAAGKAS
jgi:hypothetical protein